MAVTSSTVELFPACPTFGFTAEPMILTKIVSREGGYETVNRVWDQALRRYSGVPLGDQPESDIQDVLYFWLAVGGMAGQFRFKDWSDYLSCQVGATATATDQPLRLVTGSPGGYLLTKRYTHGSLTHTRDIRRPKGSTIIVANELGVTQATSTYTVEEDTGLIVPNGSFSGTPTTWGGEFYVLCRFDSELPIVLSNHKIQNLQVSLIEKREDPL